MAHDAGSRQGVLIGMLAAVAAISTAAIGIRFAGAWPPIWIACGRVVVTALALLPFAARGLPALIRLTRQDRELSIRIFFAGTLLAAHFGTWIASLAMTSVVTSVALVATQPLFASLFSRMMGERVPTRIYLGSGVALAGGLWMTGGSLGDPMGALLALVGAAFAAGYLAIGRTVRDRVELTPYLVAVNFAAALQLAVVGLRLHLDADWSALWTLPAVAPAGGAAWMWVVYIGLVPGLIGHGLLNRSVRHMPLHWVSMLILIEPIGSGLLAWGVLAEVPNTAELVGGLIILAGVAFGASSARSDGSD